MKTALENMAKSMYQGSPIRGNKAVDVPDCCEYIESVRQVIDAAIDAQPITKEEKNDRKETNTKIFADVRKCLEWVEQNG
tara:strand:- start:99 stop:338 length:240 start_codon:yes stop_codon:yes gene_type:complete